MDLNNPSNNRLHSNFQVLDKIVEVPLSKAHSSVSPQIMCKCKEQDPSKVNKESRHQSEIEIQIFTNRQG